MYCYRNRLFILCIVIAIISIVQTALHLVWLMYGHYLYECEYKPKNIFVYLISLTYFYREKCTTMTLIDNEVLCDNFTNELFGDENGTICRFAKDFNDRALIRNEFEANTLQSMHIFYLIGTLDCLWVVASVALLMGSCVKIKEAWSVLFYAPWLILTTIISVTDVVLTCKFANDIERTNDVTKWLKFMGVENYEDFSEYNDGISQRLTTLSSIIMCALASRLGILTLVNILSIVIVMKTATIAYRMSFIDENVRRRIRNTIVFTDSSPNSDVKFDTAAARIRSWQMFYGTGPSNSKEVENSHTDCKENTSDRLSSDKDLNSNSLEKNNEVTTNDDNKSYDFVSDVSHIEEERHVGYIEIDSTEMSEHPQRFGSQQSAVVELRGQLPWSYFPKEEDTLKKTPVQVKAVSKKPSEYTDVYPRHSSSLSICASRL